MTTKINEIFISAYGESEITVYRLRKVNDATVQQLIESSHEVEILADGQYMDYDDRTTMTLVRPKTNTNELYVVETTMHDTNRVGDVAMITVHGIRGVADIAVQKLIESAKEVKLMNPYTDQNGRATLTLSSVNAHLRDMEDGVYDE